jgi:hypothetical protein
MAIITGGTIIEGTYDGLFSAGAPTAGTTEVQTLTIGGTPTGGSFILAYDGYNTAAIPWSATNATLIASIDAALEALPNIGTGGITTAAGTVTAGIGTITLTWAGNQVLEAVNTITVASNSMTGTSPTVAVAETTPGVSAFGRGAPTGAKATDTTNGLAYINTGTALSPTWTKIGVQT